MGSVIACGGGDTCTLVITPYVATPEDYQAVSIIFGLTLGAACVIWGVKQIYNLLKDRPEA